MALLLKPNGTIRSIPLGAAEPIDVAIANAVAASSDPRRQAEAPERLAAVSQQLPKGWRTLHPAEPLEGG